MEWGLGLGLGLWGVGWGSCIGKGGVGGHLDRWKGWQ